MDENVVAQIKITNILTNELSIIMMFKVDISIEEEFYWLRRRDL